MRCDHKDKVQPMKQIGRGGSVSLGLPPNSSRLPELPIGLTRLHMEAMRPRDLSLHVRLPGNRAGQARDGFEG